MDAIVSSAAGELRNLNPEFHDARLDEMAFRYRARNHPEYLSAEERKRWDTYRRALWSDGQKINEYLARLELLRLADAGQDQLELLDDLKEWAEKLLKSIE
jgi:exodeoxyribonuclease-1